MLTIAGSDSGGGAGIQADLKTISALGAFGVCAVTAVTAQNTLGVQAVHSLPPKIVGCQIDSVMSDIGAAAAKTGMLANAQIICTVAERIRAHEIEKLVVDPVMVAKGGARLLAERAMCALMRELLPLALVLTPNLDEAERLVEFEVRDEDGMKRAARAIRDMGARYVYVKGGHLAGEAVDILFDGKKYLRLSAPRLAHRNTHGTGCILSAALATYLAQGRTVPAAAYLAKTFVTEAIRRGLAIGHGIGPANPIGPPRNSVA